MPSSPAGGGELARRRVLIHDMQSARMGSIF